MIGLPTGTVGLGNGVSGITIGVVGDLVTVLTVLALVERRVAAIGSKIRYDHKENQDNRFANERKLHPVGGQACKSSKNECVCS